MAGAKRRKPGGPLKAHKALAAAVEKPAERRAAKGMDRGHPKVRALTREFHHHRNTMFRDAVESVREMGRILVEGERLIDRSGEYHAWVDEDLDVGTSTAKNYRRLYRVSVENPGLYLAWKDIGPVKFYRLARLPRESRAKALGPKSRKDEVVRMNDADFKAATERYVGRKQRVTDNMRAHGLRLKVRALVVKLTEAQRYRGLDDEGVRRGLCDDLTKLVREVAALKRAICRPRRP